MISQSAYTLERLYFSPKSIVVQFSKDGLAHSSGWRVFDQVPLEWLLF
jgi:hypothetical protein